jgi:hypothetical protein
VTDYRDNTSGPKQDEIENGFEVHRVEFGISGTAFSKDLSYNILWATGGNSGSMSLLDAYATYMFSDAIGVRAGQFTENFTHEDFIGDGGLLAVERSLLDAALGGYTNRIQGVSMLYGNYSDKNPLNVEVAFTDGANSINSNYVGHYSSDPDTFYHDTYDSDGYQTGEYGVGFGNHAFDWGAYARAEYKFSGSWADYQDLTGKNVGKQDLFVLGGAVAYDQGGDANVWGFTADAQYKSSKGFAIYGAAVVRVMNAAAVYPGVEDDQTDWGLLLQGSYMFTPALEGFVRGAYVSYDNGYTYDYFDKITEDTFYEVTVGANYYLGKNGDAGNRAKITVDLSWLPNGTPGSMTSLGYLGDSNFDNEIVLRGQFQLAL